MHACLKFDLDVKLFFVIELFCGGRCHRDTFVQYHFGLTVLEFHQWRWLCQEVAQGLAFHCAWLLVGWCEELLPLCVIVIVECVHFFIFIFNKWTKWLPVGAMRCAKWLPEGAMRAAGRWLPLGATRSRWLP